MNVDNMNLTIAQNAAIEDISNFIDPKNSFEKNRLGIVTAGTGTGKTTITFQSIIPKAILEFEYELVLFQTTSIENLTNIYNNYQRYLIKKTNADFIINDSEKKIKSKIKRILRNEYPIILCVTHAMFTKSGESFVKLALDKGKKVLIIKDEVSAGSTSGSDTSYASKGQEGLEASKNAIVISNLLNEYGSDNLRAFGLSGTPTEEMTKTFGSVSARRPEFEKLEIPYPGQSSLYNETERDIPLSKIQIGNYDTSDMYTVIHNFDIDATRQSKAFVASKYFYKLGKGNSADTVEFGNTVGNMLQNITTDNETLTSIHSLLLKEIAKQNISITFDKTFFERMFLIFVGHETEDQTITGKTLLLWQQAIPIIKEECEKNGIDLNKIILYTGEIFSDLNDKSLRDQYDTFDDAIESGNFLGVVVKNKLIDGYDEPRFKAIVSARMLKQYSREKEDHIAVITRFGQMLGRVARIDNGIEGVWDRKQLKAFLSKIKDPKVKALLGQYVIIRNSMRWHLPRDSATSCCGALVDVKSSGNEEDFLQDLNIDRDQIDKYGFKTPSLGQGGDQIYKEYREENPHCEVCEKNENGIPICEASYISQELSVSLENILACNDVHHKDGDHQNNNWDNLLTVCKVRHNELSVKLGHYKPINQR